MTTKTLNDHIVSTPGVVGGKPRIAGHRITVEDIMVWHELMGQSADEIAWQTIARRHRAHDDGHVVHGLDQPIGLCHLAIVHVDDAANAFSHLRHLEQAHSADHHQQREDGAEAKGELLAQRSTISAEGE